MATCAAEQRRQYYRLKYPRRARPVVKIADALYHVSEVSEQGLRVEMANVASTLYRGLTLKGILKLHNETQINVEGQILRWSNQEVVIKLSQGPSFKHMVAEQRHIRQNYPVFFA
ncbi:PilZ domain-containing protein [Vibrio sp.]|uniref:PilZ domain-containing protein n=1 Tax=Vibrio sp. TaxID=678 RepID=UPI003D10348F